MTVSDNGNSWTLDNGIVEATITEDRGSMPSLIYRGMQMLAARGAPGGGTLCDIEIRYSLGKGDSGVYVYSILQDMSVDILPGGRISTTSTTLKRLLRYAYRIQSYQLAGEKGWTGRRARGM